MQLTNTHGRVKRWKDFCSLGMARIVTEEGGSFRRPVALALHVLVGIVMGNLQPVFSQGTAVVRGTVTDSSSGKPVPHAIVIVQGTSLGTSADSAGNFLLRRVRKGSSDLVIRHLGYGEAVYSLEIPQAIDTVSVQIFLQPSILPLPGITTTGSRLHRLERDSVFRRFARVIVSAKQLAEETLINFDEFIHRHAPWAAGEFDLWLDGSRFPLESRDVIDLRQVQEIFIWKRMDAPVEFTGIFEIPVEPPPERVNLTGARLPSVPLQSPLLDRGVSKAKRYIILVRTRWF